MPTRPQTASNTPVDENLDDDVYTDDWLIKAREPQARNYFVASQPTIDLLEKQKFDQI